MRCCGLEDSHWDVLAGWVANSARCGDGRAGEVRCVGWDRGGGGVDGLNFVHAMLQVARIRLISSQDRCKRRSRRRKRACLTSYSRSMCLIGLYCIKIPPPPPPSSPLIPPLNHLISLACPRAAIFSVELQP
jgi:hypothetical protein